MVGPHEAEAPRLEVAADLTGQLGLCRQVGLIAPAAHHRAAVDEVPQVGAEAPELLLNGQEGARVVDRGGHLQPVAHDLRVAEQRIALGVAVAGHAGGIEALVGAPVAVPLGAGWCASSAPPAPPPGPGTRTAPGRRRGSACPIRHRGTLPSAHRRRTTRSGGAPSSPCAAVRERRRKGHAIELTTHTSGYMEQRMGVRPVLGSNT